MHCPLTQRRSFCFILLLALTAALSPFRLGAQSGLPDPGFDPGTGVDLSVYWVTPLAGGQILIAGDFTSFNDVERVNVARLNSDGSRDNSFNPGSALDGAFPYANVLALQATGKILVGGNFTNSAATNFTRLDSNGNLDTAFKVNADDSVYATVIQTNGSIVIGGFFSHVNGLARTALARMDANGSIDQAFNPTVLGGQGAIYAMALQSDAKILVAGSFTTFSNTPRTNIARLNTDGSVDSTFLPVVIGGGQISQPSLYSVAVDSKGRIIIGGDFFSVNGQVRTNVARLNSNGTLDPTFNPAAGTDYPVNSVVVEQYDRILLGGYFITVNNVGNNSIARLNDDGTLDRSFNTGSGASDVVYSLALQADGKVLVGGAFVDINGTFFDGIGRLQNLVTVSPPRLVNPNLSNTVFRASVSTYSGKTYTLQFKNALSDSTWTALTPQSGDGTLKTLTDSSATVARRFYRVEVH